MRLSRIFLRPAALYEISSGPQLARHGPEPKDSPRINKLKIILRFTLKVFFGENFSGKNIKLGGFIFPSIGIKACLMTTKIRQEFFFGPTGLCGNLRKEYAAVKTIFYQNSVSA